MEFLNKMIRRSRDEKIDWGLVIAELNMLEWKEVEKVWEWNEELQDYEEVDKDVHFDAVGGKTDIERN